MAAIDVAGENVVFTSNIQGPMNTSTLATILAESHQLVIVGGHSTYFAGFRVKDEHVKTRMQNLRRLVESMPTTIFGHLILRDEKCRSHSQQIVDVAPNVGHNVLTAAEYFGKENIFLEFRRR